MDTYEVKSSEKPLAEARYVRPKIVWEVMKTAQYNRQTVYISGDTGYGKLLWRLIF